METPVVCLLISFVCIVAGSVDQVNKPLGCYKDNSKDRAIKGYEVSFRKTIDWSLYPDLSPKINECGEWAKNKGCVIFGVQNWAECFCSTDKDVDYQKYGGGTEDVNCISGVGKGGYNFVYRLEGCQKDGNFYSQGLAIPNEDDCMSCRCGDDNEEKCSYHDCMGLYHCEVQKKVAGQCCKICACEDKDGSSYSDGEEWISKEIVQGRIECTQCTCNNGEAECSIKHCPELACTETTQRPEDCCPSCKPNDAVIIVAPTTRPLPTFNFPFPDDDEEEEEDFKR